MALSTEGISHQIVSSLITYTVDGFGTVNDCKVVINHLIRKFSEPLGKEGKQVVHNSRSIDVEKKIIKEHLIPVNEIMNYLLALNLDKPKKQLATEIENYLEKALVIVNITKEEDAKLNSCGFQRHMPEEYKNSSHEFFNDIWARYKLSGIFENIEISRDAV